MMVLFQLGTTIIFGFAASSGRDAWIAQLISIACGVLEVLMFSAITRLQPGLTLVEWFPAQFGRWLGVPIAWMYPLLFIYGAARIITDLRDLFQATILRQTHPLLYLSIFVAVAGYAVFAGIEVLGRIALFWLPVFLFAIIVEAILLFSTGYVHFEHLQPVLYEGWGRIWKNVWPLGVTQSFGETLIFAMVWTSLKKPDRILQTSVTALLLSGSCIAMLNIFAICVFGEEVFMRSMYPLYLLLRQINIGNFLENLDVLGVLYFCITSFFKLSIYLYAVAKGIQQLMLLQTYRKVILPAAILILFVGMTMATSQQEHLEVGLNIYPRTLWVPMLLMLPAFLLVVIWTRNLLSKRS